MRVLAIALLVMTLPVVSTGAGILAGSALASGLDAPAGKPAAWYLLFRHGNVRKAVSSDGKHVVDLKDDSRLKYDDQTLRQLQLPAETPTSAVLSPVGRQLAYIGLTDNGQAIPHPFNGQVCVCRPDGREARVLVPAVARRHSLSWSPAGNQLAFDEDMRVHGEPGALGPEWMTQVHIIDVATGVVRRTFGGTSSVSRPQFTPKGNLTYHIDRGQQGKLRLVDLYFQKLGGAPNEEFVASVTMVNQQFIIGSAVSPDESKLACTTPGLMFVRSRPGNAEETWSVDDVGKQLGIQWQISFADPVWRPDGRALACRCTVLGGRNAGDRTPIKGAEKVVTFPLGGKAQAFDFDPSFTLDGWATPAEIERLRK